MSLETVSPENWKRSDQYHNSFLIKPDDALEHALTFSAESGLPQIQVSPAQGKLLYLIAKSINAKRVLEVGTLGG
jgi:predicted O-methyltransferase YrrM